MDDVKYGEILLPGDEETQERREKNVRRKFWPTFRKAARRVPFSRDLVAAYYCALDRETPLKVRGTLLAALAYFVLPVDMVPDLLVGIGFSDDIAVLSAAFAMVNRNIRPSHYEAADKALQDAPDRVRPEDMKTV